jgi:hypothetical protein
MRYRVLTEYQDTLGAESSSKYASTRRSNRQRCHCIRMHLAIGISHTIGVIRIEDGTRTITGALLGHRPWAARQLSTHSNTALMSAQSQQRSLNMRPVDPMLVATNAHVNAYMLVLATAILVQPRRQISFARFARA